MSLVNSILEQLINGLRTGSIYALIALGYTMVYGIAKMINFAHGDIIMVGAYSLYVFTALLGLPVPVAIILTIIVCAVLGITVERIAYKPLRNAPSLAVLITAIGVSYFCRMLHCLFLKQRRFLLVRLLKYLRLKSEVYIFRVLPL